MMEEREKEGWRETERWRGKGGRGARESSQPTSRRRERSERERGAL